MSGRSSGQTAFWAAVMVGFTAVVVAGSVLTRPSEPALPGVDLETFPPSLAAELARAPDRVAVHTPNVRADGTPRYTNRLLKSSSPYLIQHGHDPVNWFPWGEEAFELARRLNRPVFLSIGYATCHWCHVMQDESFSDPAIAALLNADFIAIKVDRETRPDVDGVYMEAVKALHGSGGWPATLWLTPDRRPFFAATYLPARDGDRGQRTGLETYLREIARGWRETPDAITGDAAQITAVLQERLAPPPVSGELPADPRTGMEAWVRQVADVERGGRAGRMKFPSGLPLRAMIASPDAEIRGLADHTLLTMLAGGIWDQVGGGYHRYATDPDWRVPHFEKTLYDNALLARVHAEAFQAGGDLRHAVAVEEILTFLARDLGARGSGGYISGLDADAPVTPGGERVEGAHVVWTEAQVREVLGDRSDAVLDAWNLRGPGPVDGAHVPSWRAIPTLAERRALGRERLDLLLARSRRPAPARDDKILVGWNGLAIAAFAHAGWLLGRTDWLDEARGTAELLLEAEEEAGRLPRLIGPNGPEGTGYLEDHAYLIDGLVTLFEATGEVRWLEEALRLTDVTAERFGDPGAWYGTPADVEALLVREKPVVDQTTPGANAVMVGNLVRLAALTSEDRYRSAAEGIARGLALEVQPAAAAEAVLALSARPLKEIVLVAAEGERAPDLMAVVRTVRPSSRVLVQLTPGDPDLERLVPPAAGKLRLDGRPTVYVCQGGVCDQPTTDPGVLASLLASPRR